VESHISRKTSEIWGTRQLLQLGSCTSKVFIPLKPTEGLNGAPSFARLFRPRYALANLGHPSSSYWVLIWGEPVVLGRQGGQGVLDRGGPSGRNGVAPEVVEF
jgi:hypothetical protein